ncbi:MAG: hypothetical protein AB1633_06170, partial [Elusimicrobiota bacterium]
MKLGTKFSVSASALVLVVVAGVGSLLYFAEKKLLIDEIESKENAQARGLAEVCRQAVITQDDLLIVNYIRKLKETEGVSYAMFVNMENSIITHTDNEQIGKKSVLRVDPSSVLPFRQNYIEKENVVDVALPCVDGANRYGIAHVGFSQDFRQKKILDTLEKTRNRILSIGGISLVIGVVMSAL